MAAYSNPYLVLSGDVHFAELGMAKCAGGGQVGEGDHTTHHYHWLLETRHAQRAARRSPHIPFATRCSPLAAPQVAEVTSSGITHAWGLHWNTQLGMWLFQTFVPQRHQLPVTADELQLAKLTDLHAGGGDGGNGDGVGGSGSGSGSGGGGGGGAINAATTGAMGDAVREAVGRRYFAQLNFGEVDVDWASRTVTAMVRGEEGVALVRRWGLDELVLGSGPCVLHQGVAPLWKMHLGGTFLILSPFLFVMVIYYWFFRHGTPVVGSRG